MLWDDPFKSWHLSPRLRIILHYSAQALVFLHPLLSPTPCLPSPFPSHLCGHDCCEYHREKEVTGERKKKRSGRRLPPVLPLIDSGTVFVFLDPCHLKINILFRFQFRDCEGNTLQLYCVPNSEKSHSLKIERVLTGFLIGWTIILLSYLFTSAIKWPLMTCRVTQYSYTLPAMARMNVLVLQIILVRLVL
jgi:hypothetical protein